MIKEWLKSARVRTWASQVMVMNCFLDQTLGPSTHNREIHIAASCPATPPIVDSIAPPSILALTHTMSFLRIAARAVRAPAQPRIQVASRIQRLNQARTFSVASVKRADVDAHDPHHEESFEEFTARCV